MPTSQTSRINEIATHTQRLGGRAVDSLLFHFFILFLFCTSRTSDSVANNKVVYCFHVKCIQNLLQMVMAQSFFAWAERRGYT